MSWQRGPRPNKLGQGGNAAPRPAQTTAPAAGQPPAPDKRVRREQEWALTAYDWAKAAETQGWIKEYKTAVHTFAATLLQAGLAVAVSVLERDAKDAKDRKGPARAEAAALLWRQLAGGADCRAWAEQVRAEELSEYRLRSRELRLRLAWLVRAVRAVQIREEAPCESS